MIKFTAIMPVYNSKDKIRKSIESVLNQTYKNWELIIVDDGSTDNTYKTCEQYSKKDKRIIVYKKENEGPGKARNYGIKRSSGDYICFIDSDDYVEMDYFELLAKHIEKENSDVVFFNVVSEDKDGKIEKIYNVQRFKTLGQEELIKMQIMGLLSWAAWIKAAKSNIIKKYSFSDLSVGEEAIFSFYVLKSSKKIGFIDKNLYHYVFNPTGQHKKGGMDPWNSVANEIKRELLLNDNFNKYELAVNGLALRGLCIAIKRISCANNYKNARKQINEHMEKYKEEFDIFNVEKQLLDRTSKIIKTLIKLKLFLIIYIGTKLKYKKQV